MRKIGFCAFSICSPPIGCSPVTAIWQAPAFCKWKLSTQPSASDTVSSVTALRQIRMDFFFCFQDTGNPSFGAADENSVRRGQPFQNLGRHPFHCSQIAAAKFLPVTAYQFNALRIAFHGVYPSFSGGQRQFHGNRAGPCPTIIDDILFFYRKLAQYDGTHLAFGHRHPAAQKAFLRDSRDRKPAVPVID